MIEEIKHKLLLSRTISKSVAGGKHIPSTLRIIKTTKQGRDIWNGSVTKPLNQMMIAIPIKVKVNNQQTVNYS
jgi:hypothetical protein